MPSSQTDGGGYVIGCAVVILLVVLAAGGLAYALAELFSWADRHGVQPGALVMGAVMLMAIFSLYQVRKNRW